MVSYDASLTSRHGCVSYRRINVRQGRSSVIFLGVGAAFRFVIICDRGVQTPQTSGNKCNKWSFAGGLGRRHLREGKWYLTFGPALALQAAQSFTRELF
jgi:hypothetical protein